MEAIDLNGGSLRISREGEERVSKEIRQFFERNADAISDTALKQFMRGKLKQEAFLLESGDIEIRMTPNREEGEDEPITIKSILVRHQDWHFLQ